MKFLSEFEANLGIRIQCSREFEPLGTAGPLALAKDKLIDGSGQPIFVLSSDVICEFPLKEMLEFHKSCCAEASVMVTRVCALNSLHFCSYLSVGEHVLPFMFHYEFCF